MKIPAFAPISILIISLLGLACSPASNANLPETDYEQSGSLPTDSIKPDAFIAEFCTELHQKYHFNGNVLIAKKGKIIYENSFGWANYLLKDSLKENNQFQLASVSKTFTGTATLQLVEKGKLSLDDKIEKFFPNFPFKEISIRMLLSHRSGLTNYVYFTDTYWKNKNKPMSNQDVIDLFVKYKPTMYAKPDTRFHYNNTNFMMLGAIIEKVTDESLDKYLEKHIFKIAGMKHSFQYQLSKKENYKINVIGHDRGSFRYSVVPNFLDEVVGDKGIYSTVRDLYFYHKALINGKLLSKKWLDSAYTGRNKPIHGRFNYGYGWRIFDGDAHQKVVYHTGWWHGFKNILVRDLNKDILIIFLGNLSNGSLQHLDKLYTYLGTPVIRQGAYNSNGVYHADLSSEED